jgi:hypothetical protein
LGGHGMVMLDFRGIVNDTKKVLLNFKCCAKSEANMSEVFTPGAVKGGEVNKQEYSIDELVLRNLLRKCISGFNSSPFSQFNSSELKQIMLLAEKAYMEQLLKEKQAEKKMQQKTRLRILYLQRVKSKLLQSPSLPVTRNF